MEDAEKLRIYREDISKYTGKYSPISTEVRDYRLDDLETQYGKTSRISGKNGNIHKSIIWDLSALGTVLTICFLFYDELELHGLILACIFAIACLFIIRYIAKKNRYHKKYMEYRVIAETMRVQFFLSIAGITKPATELLPWFIKKGIPWIDEAIEKQPVLPKNEKKLIIDFWIRNQRDYHINAIEKQKIQLKRNKRVGKIVLLVTFLTYGIALVFEAYMFFYSIKELNYDWLIGLLKIFNHYGMMEGYTPIDMIRAILKIVIGSMSATALFAANYYGKLSLSDIIEDHERMVDLYDKFEEDLANGETEELILELAREFLIEIGAWYAYQNQNKPDLVY